jgi:hypothetical protein
MYPKVGLVEETKGEGKERQQTIIKHITSV